MGMSVLTLKNVPNKIHRWLKLSAKLHHRSLNKEDIMLLGEKLFAVPSADTEKFLEEVRGLRKLTAKNPLTPEILDRAIAEGRS